MNMTAATQSQATATDAPRKASWLPLAVTLVVAIIVWILYLLMQAGTVEAPERTATRFILPAGFSGSVKVYYGVEGREPLPEQEGFRIVEVPPSGIVAISSEPLYGRALDQFVRLADDQTAEPETLGYHYVRDRKNGITGDNKEYFLRPEEMEQRDTELVRHGIIDPRDGTPKYGVPYELFTIRDDF